MSKKNKEIQEGLYRILIGILLAISIYYILQSISHYSILINSLISIGIAGIIISIIINIFQKYNGIKEISILILKAIIIGIFYNIKYAIITIISVFSFIISGFNSIAIIEKLWRNNPYENCDVIMAYFYALVFFSIYLIFTKWIIFLILSILLIYLPNFYVAYKKI
ncbi:MAG: hypothetical protein ACYCS1_05240 [Gammaproteobacteria bacterium]